MIESSPNTPILIIEVTPDLGVVSFPTRDSNTEIQRKLTKANFFDSTAHHDVDDSLGKFYLLEDNILRTIKLTERNPLTNERFVLCKVSVIPEKRVNIRKQMQAHEDTIAVLDIVLS